MSIDSWVIVADDGPVDGPLAVARGSGGRVTALVVGPRGRADAVAAAGPDDVLWFAADETTPVEAHARQVAEAAAQAAPRVVLATTRPGGRMLLGAVATRLGAATVASVVSVAEEGDTVVVRRSVAEGRAVEVLGAAGPLAGLVAEGVAAGTAPAGAAQVRVAPATDPGDGLRVVGSSEEAGGGGVATADRVVGVGRGLVAKADLALVESLAGVLHAAVACSLPLCDDLHWFDHTHVVGSSSQRISPRLYVAVGISGQPQHTTGIRGAKTVVAIDDDPDAPIFREAAYGIVGDLYAVVPALTAALAAS